MRVPSRRRTRDNVSSSYEAALDGLELPDPFRLEAFLETLAERRGRPIRLIAVPAEVPDFPSALWVPFSDEDLLFADETVSTWHSTLCVLHECGHMLLEHTPRVPDDDSWTRALTHISGETAVAVLARSLYEEPEERDADMVATILASRIKRAAPTEVPNRVASAEAAEEVLARLRTALGERS